MKLDKKSLAVLLSLSVVSPAYAAWGDQSHDPNPSLFDEDQAAQFDTFGILTHVLATYAGQKTIQNFETGYSQGQVLDNWISLSTNRVRFGFGNTLTSVHWQSVIGTIDTDATAFGLNHPHGTYGNSDGVADQPRNYIADLNFLTTTTGTSSPGYFVMEFLRPISFLAFSMIDYGSAGDTFGLTLWNGSNLDDLVQLPQSPSGNASRTVQDGQVAGGFEYLVARGSSTGYELPTFNYAILRLDGNDSTVGFDNFVIGQNNIPEPASLSLAALGLAGLTGLRRRRRGR